MSPPTHFLSGTGKPPPEKSKFLQTCNRLSLFLKENNINLGINAKFDATTTTGGIETSGSEAAEARTIDLLSTIDDDTAAEKPAADESPLPPAPPEYVILDSSCELVSNKGGGGSSSSSNSAQTMTIFYGGQVVVLDDVPAERAKDVMLMAAQKPQLSKSAAAGGGGGGGGEKDSDLPIARRASLHKFLAKRKDRSATVRASPYCPSTSGNDHTFDLNSNPPT